MKKVLTIDLDELKPSPIAGMTFEIKTRYWEVRIRDGEPSTVTLYGGRRLADGTPIEVSEEEVTEAVEEQTELSGKAKEKLIETILFFLNK